MKKFLSIFVLVFLCFAALGCQQQTTTEITSTTVSPPFPSIDYPSYTVEYIVIRQIDALDRTISLDYHYDNLSEASTQISTILTSLSTVEQNGGIGPRSGMLNNGWAILSGPENTSLLLNFYIYEEYTILGVSEDEHSIEYYFRSIFDNEIYLILASFDDE